MNETETRFLERKATQIRKRIVEAIASAGVGHIGGCLSVADVLTVLYYKHMRIDCGRPDMCGRDRLIMSKGHAGPAVYAVLADKGYFPIEALLTVNQPETRLPSHCDMVRTRGVDMTAGSLGQGLSCAVGMAKASKIKKDGARIYAIIGDGESQEGQIWEASMLAAHLKLDNLIAFLDYNKLQIDGPICDINGLEPVGDKWAAFGWNVLDVPDGNDTAQIDEAIARVKTCVGKPSMLILNTVKGKGVSFVECAGAGNHNMTFSQEQKRAALAELDKEMA
ncbi:MAG: transketolase [Oscillospiraceae bacterium]|jgi:transketolase|nr:transketolase [Oscillospiraceae bacterium]